MIKGKIESITRPDVNPEKKSSLSFIRAQTVEPKLEVAHANPIRISLMVDLISGRSCDPLLDA